MKKSPHARPLFRGHGSSGLSLVAMLVALGILAGLGLVVVRYFNNSLESTRAIAARGEVEDLRKFLRASFDCKETATRLPAGCPVGTAVTLYRKSGKVLIAATPATAAGTPQGAYELRAQCGAGTQISVMYRLKGDKTRWEELFTEVPLTCR